MTNISFIGAQGSGKSTMARTVRAAFNSTFPTPDEYGRPRAVHASFAEGLRVEVAEAYVSRFAGKRRPDDLMMTVYREMSDPEKKETWRPVLQAWGVLRRERDGENYWCDTIEEVISSGYEFITVDDCRFPNEYAMLRRRGFIFVKLEPHDDTPQLDHESEHYWPTFDCEVTLAGTLPTRMNQLQSWLSNSGYETW